MKRHEGFLLAAVMLVGVIGRPAIAAPPSEVWSVSWNGPGDHDDHGLLVASDPAGPLYVAGTTYEGGLGGHQEDFVLQRFDADGNLLWTRTYGGSGYDAPSALSVMASGNVAMAGYAWKDGQATVTTLCYLATGDTLWTRSVPLPGGIVLNAPPDLAIDDDGNLLVSASSNDDFRVLKYAANGDSIWDRTYDSPSGAIDRPMGVAADANGDVYVTGLSVDTMAGTMTYVTAKFDAAGTFEWEWFGTGDIGSVFEYVDVTIAPDGDVVVVGNPESTCGLFQVRVWSLAAATGAEQWVESFPPQPCDSIVAVDMAVDGQGNVYAAGFGTVGDANIHFQTVAYGPDGAFRWHRTFDGPGTSVDVASSVTLDDAGAVYVAGASEFPPQDRDLVAVKYQPDGTEEWFVHWAGPAGRNDGAEDVTVSDAGDVILTGHTFSPEDLEDAVTVLYRPQPTAAPPAVEATPLRAISNPFSQETVIAYHLERAGWSRLSIFDVRGRRVRVLHEGIVGSGRHEVTWRADDDQGRRVGAGVYFARLESEIGVRAMTIGLVR